MINSYICGVDEAGRGPLAGPVVAAAVILDPNIAIQGINDSKKLSEKKREKIFYEICENSVSWSVGRADVYEIDNINILQASLLAMQRAISGLHVKPNHALIDGNILPKDLPCSAEAIIGGDAINMSISAASIIAKVTRDKEMIEIDTKYPHYGFAQNKGYPTKKHLKALNEYGISPVHRKSFGPVMKLLRR